MGRDRVIAGLRARIAQVQRGGRQAPRARTVLPFGLPALDGHLPEGGLALGGLHEILGGGPDADHAAAATLFVAGVLARLSGPVLWALKARDLFAPGLAGAGLHPDRVIYAEAGRDEAGILRILEEGLRHGGLAGVVGEVARLPLTASRRLQLAAEGANVPALVLRRWQDRAGQDGVEPGAALTRWRISALPSPAPAAGDDTPGIDRARWHVALLRCRGGAEAEWIMEACDAQGRLAVPADLADRPAAVAPARNAAEGRNALRRTG